MSLDPRTPVLVGAAAVTQREDDPLVADEAVELMARAASAAAPATLLRSAGLFAVPEGTWAYPDPGRELARRFGAASATTLVADIGVTQEAVIGEVCRLVASASVDVAVVVGGEARYRALRAKLAGIEVGDRAQADGTIPDRKLEPSSLGIHEIEMTRNAVTPATAYALVENARMHRLGRSPAVHRKAVGELWSSFSSVASQNPDAWDREPHSAAAIVTPSADNRVISWPYTKRMCSQWNVDQAAALVICSVEAAEGNGIGRDRWVFPWSSVTSDHSIPVVQRDPIDSCPGAIAAAAAALELAGVGVDDVAALDLYSCFPAAVQAYADALGVADRRPLTVTGGMSFAGGPLNNYVLQAMVALWSRLVADPGTIGLSSSVSGFLHKQGFGLWSTEPPPNGYRSDDVSAAVAGTQVRPVAADHVGTATIASWTVDHQAGEPFRAVVIADVGGDDDAPRTLASAARTLASTGDVTTCRAMCDGDWIGHRVDIRADGSFTLS